MKIFLAVLLYVVLTFAANQHAHANQNQQPITEDGLISLFQNKIQRPGLVRAIETYGVAFQITSLFEQEIAREGEYLGPKGVAAIVSAIRANFRPPLVRPYRLTYRILKGRAVDLLLDGKIGRWEKGLDGKFFIVQNEIFKTVSDLVLRFSEPFSDDRFLRLDGPRRSTRNLAVRYKNEDKSMFVGSSGEVYAQYGKVSILESRLGEVFFSAKNIAGLVDSLNDSKKHWNFYAFKEKPTDVQIFRKFAEPGDLAYFESPLQEFYSYITKDYLPPDFGIVQLAITEIFDEGACGHHAQARRKLEWDASFFGPLLRMNVAIIENVSNEPITVGRFILRENESTRLQTRSAVRAGLSSQQPVKQFLFEPGILKPGESLVIPIELTLKTDRKDLAESFDLPKYENAKFYAGILSRAKVTNGITLPGPLGETVPTVKADALERIMNEDKIDFLSSNEYVYGPSVSLESLEINRFGYLARQFDSSKLLITSASDGEEEIGSCPYVYTYSTLQKSWLSEGVILYGLNSKLKESMDEIPLRQFNGEVLLQEQDPENSFIDSVYIRAVSADGNETFIYPAEPALRVADGVYFQMRQGDRRIVKFLMPEKLAAEKYFLVASGYYVPYHSLRRMRPGIGVKSIRTNYR